MEGVWPIIFLGIVLKIPVAFGLWLVWWAIKEEPRLDDVSDADEHGFRRWRREPTRPRGPRRGPHGGGVALPPCPPGGRVRVAHSGRPVRERVSSASRY
jgi:hypothetical protein